MFTSENHVGRLIELRVASPVKDEEFDELQRTHVANIRRVGGSFVAVTDLRRAHVFASGIAERAIEMMSRANPALERSALLISDSAIFGLQAERALAESENPNRRTFREPRELETWLGEVLTDAEKKRLREFLRQA